MARNPKWWKDSEAKADEKSTEKSSDFDPASLDGEPVPSSLNHEKLDAVIAHRQLDTSDLADDATRAQKVAFINDAGIL